MGAAAAPIVVVARWQVGAEAVDAVIALVAELRRATLAEPGCLGYDAYRSVAQPGELLLLERYRDMAAIEAHRATPHYQDLVVKRIVPMLAGREVELLQPRE
jgi:quinol monooxygenase YgiN